MDYDKLNIPEPDMQDVAHTGVTTFLSSIPGIAGLGELFKFTVDSSLDKRRRQWMEVVREMLIAHDSRHSLTVDELGRNEEFISLLLDATQAAVKTHLAEKLNALKNVLLNALSSTISFELSETYIDLISRLTLTQVQLVGYIKDVPSGRPGKGSDAGESFYASTKALFGPDMEQPVFKIFLDSLEQTGLVQGYRGPIFVSEMDNADDRVWLADYELTDFGAAFLKFINEPT